jgi:hypothetical protein
MATKSDQIRTLARSGETVSQIARKLAIRYQHAYNVCRVAGLIQAHETSSCASFQVSKPRLTVELLIAGGFRRAGEWYLSDGKLERPNGLPNECGVYAFSIGEEAVYVGVASKSLSKRVYLYSRPGSFQLTNLRLNGLIRKALIEGQRVDIHFARAPVITWNNFTIRGAEGLEAGLIADYAIPWNLRGMGAI